MWIYHYLAGYDGSWQAHTGIEDYGSINFYTEMAPGSLGSRYEERLYRLDAINHKCIDINLKQDNICGDKKWGSQMDWHKLDKSQSPGSDIVAALDNAYEEYKEYLLTFCGREGVSCNS